MTLTGPVIAEFFNLGSSHWVVRVSVEKNAPEILHLYRNAPISPNLFSDCESVRTVIYVENPPVRVDSLLPAGLEQ